mmetsp:Transcript_19456/g.54674  ORF Transcript_19456/g.54674 Transcript_19456/m.54674 type:complete len:205 (-) Transcript_19456:2098-2712(-)
MNWVREVNSRASTRESRERRFVGSLMPRSWHTRRSSTFKGSASARHFLSLKAFSTCARKTMRICLTASSSSFSLLGACSAGSAACSSLGARGSSSSLASTEGEGASTGGSGARAKTCCRTSRRPASSGCATCFMFPLKRLRASSGSSAAGQSAVARNSKGKLGGRSCKRLSRVALSDPGAVSHHICRWGRKTTAGLARLASANR